MNHAFVIDKSGSMSQADKITGQAAISLGGEFLVDVGRFRVNARPFSTDDQLRDRVLRGLILMSARDEYEFIDFVPVEVKGLPDSANFGDRVTFDIVGNLTVRGVTRTITFQSVLEIVSEEEIRGSASATIRYRDFNITIPKVPFVADVSEGRRGRERSLLRSHNKSFSRPCPED